MEEFTSKRTYEAPLSKRDLSDLWGISTRTLDREVANGDLGCVKIGGRIRFLDQHIKSYLDRMNIPAKNQMAAKTVKQVLFTGYDAAVIFELGIDINEAAIMCAFNDPECFDVDTVVNPHDGDTYLNVTIDDICKACPYFTKELAEQFFNSIVNKGLVKKYKDEDGIKYYALSERGSKFKSEIV